MVCKELSNSEYNQHLNATKLLQAVNIESTLPCKIHSISCHQLIRIKQSPRARSFSIEQTTALMKLKIFKNRLHMIMNTS